MNTAEICALTEQSVGELLSKRQSWASRADASGRRRTMRWPFPGTVELWIPDEDGGEHYDLATSINLSMDGIGIRANEELRPGLQLAIAIHEPEMSFHGQAVVRHCIEIDNGSFILGLQFVYNKNLEEGT